MFNIFKKPAKLEIDAYTRWAPAYHYTPLVKAHHTLPQWWRDLPSVGRDQWGFPSFKNMNMKSCNGFIDLYKVGIMVEYWNDLVITVTKSGISQNYALSEYNEDKPHPQFQWGAGFPGHHHIKLNGPWIMEERSGTPFLFCPALWHMDQMDTPKIMPGIVNFKYQFQININMFLPIREEPYEIRLKRGTPLVQLIPLSEKPIELRRHLVTGEKFAELDNRNHPDAAGKYSDRKRLLNRAENRDQADQKCPFSWPKWTRRSSK